MAELYDMTKDLEAYVGTDVDSLEHLRWAEAKMRLKGVEDDQVPDAWFSTVQTTLHPPPSHANVRLRTHDDMSGARDTHPSQTASASVSLRLSLSSLPILQTNPTALHKLKLLAGDRWIRDPLNPDSDGELVISSKRFGERALNEKWVSDALDRLIEAACDGKDTMADIPLPTEKPKRQAGTRSRPAQIPFPEEWLADSVLADLTTERATQAAKQDALTKQQGDEADALRKSLNWDGVGIAPEGVFAKDEDVVKARATKMVLRRLRSAEKKGKASVEQVVDASAASTTEAQPST